MSDFYLDHGAYTSALGAVPTWGTPQEGDGSALGAAAASSIASILLNAQPSAGNLLSICGINFGATSGGTVNYTIGGTLSATVDNIVAAINGCTTAVGAGVAFGTPQLRNLVYARNTGGNTVEIMMRVGSATLNYASNSNVGLAQSGWGTAPTLTQFAGGSGGCWGWFVNPAAIGVSSSIAAMAYGLAVSKPMVWTAALTAADYVFVRTGTNKTITPAAGATLSRGNLGFPLNLVFDTNTKWTGDSGTGTLTFDCIGPGGGYAHFRPDASNVLGNQVSYRCLRRGNLTLTVNVSISNSTVDFFDGGTSSFSAYGVRFLEVAAPSGTVKFASQTAQTVRLINCDFDFSAYTRSTLSAGPHFAFSSGTAGAWELEDNDFRFNLTGVPADTTPLFPSMLSSGWTNYGFYLSVRNNRFSTNSSYKVKLWNSTVSSSNCFAQLVVENNTGLALDAAALGIQNAAGYTRSSRQNCLVFLGDDTTRHQRYETWNGVAEWNPSSPTPFPTLAATQPDGTAYSVRLAWLNTSAMSTFTPFSYRSSLFNRLSAAQRTIVQHLFYDTTRGIDGRQLGIVVSYVDSDGKAQCERTHFVQDPVASGATWDNAGSYAGFSAMKLTVTTANAVKQNTEIKVDVVLYGNPPGSGNADIYVDPEFALS